MEDRDVRQCLALHCLPGLGGRTLAGLLQHYGGVAPLWDADPREWRARGVEPPVAREFRAMRDRWARGELPAGLESRLAALRESGASIVTLTDAAYPSLLKVIPDPPPVLYTRGDPASLSLPQIAVVGSRKPSPGGRRASKWLAGQAVECGLAVCSGLALGVDGEAHASALCDGGVSNAVMACGIETVYPWRHRDLADRLTRAGCLVTEFPPLSRPLAARFPQRNRLISGLSLGVVVVEAALRSGSLITARMALEQGREVFALPWSVFHGSGRGCLKLLRDGAHLVETFADIAAQLGPLYAAQVHCQGQGAGAEKDTPAALNQDQRDVLALVGDECTTADEVIALSGKPAATVLATLTALERTGLIARWAGGYSRV